MQSHPSIASFKPHAADTQVAILKALLHKFVQVAADRRALAERRGRCRGDHAAIDRACRAADAEARALERVIAAVSHGPRAMHRA